MNPQKIESALGDLFESWAGEYPDLILPLAPSGSDRVYYRLQSKERVAIGTYSPNDRESRAFLEFSRHFFEKGLPVPEIYAENLGAKIYLQEDLGSTTLYSFLIQQNDYFPDYLIQIFKKVVEQLARLQILGGDGLDYASYCYPKASFDKESMFFDLNYFKYHFLMVSKAGFDEPALEKDFHTLADFLLSADSRYFLFRDFQSRNIMIRGGEPFFIDYQGGRQGALQYDLASLLFQAKANLPPDVRQDLLNHYLDTASQLTDIDRERFIEFYYGYVLIRNIQTLGAYGFRGIFERKEHFLKSIPYALRNIKTLIDQWPLPIELPELTKALRKVIDSKKYEPFDKIKGSSSLLTVEINSFSYHSTGIPEDSTGNGGGFVFDCRFIHNPGRYEPYKKLTGRDEAVINFLKQHSNIDDYLNNVFRIVDRAVEDYIDRSFTHLTVNFGCTGGQHRSVYAADELAKHVKEKYGVAVALRHIEQEKKNWKN
ncbi:MAG: RNase adapter protein RapZ [Haliscomenobacter sp.]|nr:RNase adapter protein RapZ [Haliscomenobacter sp.]